MRIVFAASEMFPYCKVGGLADFSGSLPKALASRGHDVLTVVPYYRQVRERFGGRMAAIASVPVELSGQRFDIRVVGEAVQPGLTVAFCDASVFCDRDGIYNSPEGGDFTDNHWRYALFGQVIERLPRALGFQTDVYHLNDWQTGLAAYYHKRDWGNRPIVSTIHNLVFQGLFDSRHAADLGIMPDALGIGGVLHYDAISFLKAALVYADAVTAVSPQYAREIQTPEFSGAFLGVVQAAAHKLSGIVNGVDTTVWNPRTDPLIAANYHADGMGGKLTCKRALRDRFSLPHDPRIPVIGIVARLSEQKGFSIILGAIDALMHRDLQIVVLGSGAQSIVTALEQARARYPHKLGLYVGFDENLTHAIEAGSDFFLMPSLYEPCGSNQLFSHIYGTIPIVRATGGLKDTVHEFDPRTGTGDGFAFDAYQSGALLGAVDRALWIFSNAHLMHRLIRNAMALDHSWEHSARRYEELYRRIQR